ncbi:MAG: hypothetical protein CL596_06755 [Alteromonas sp.]|nr:hypothetical protein [Alteromonas sp.]MAY22794.1 hypothetical protein [Flavobacteriaceae bacterium]|tara:strand:- start:64296 stop:64823 length:528 start_codon:yes stop_codon:yes gene_type:complete
MKILKLLSLAAMVVFFVSCSKDDDDDNNTENISADIVGTWTATDVDYYGTTTTSANGITTEADFTGEGYDINFTLTFTENPNEITSVGSYSILLTTTFNGQNIEQNVEDLTWDSTGDWSIDGTTLTTNTSGNVGVSEIQELTQNSLILYIENTEEITANGVTSTSTQFLTAKFTR